MNILFVISSLGYGGAERQLVLLSRELARLGHAVLIYTLNDDVARGRELDGSGVELVVDQKRRRLDWAVLLRLRRTARRFGADVMHGFLYDGDLYVRLAGWRLGVPIYNSERNDNYRLAPLQRLGHALTRGRIAGVVANSHAGARFARELHRLDARRVHVVWNGIDLAEIDRRLAASSQPARALWPGEHLKRVVVVGSIKPQKDYLLALQVAALLRDRDPAWRFIYVGDASGGDGAYKQRVLEHFHALGLDRCGLFTGLRDDVPELMASADALLVTSRFEGFPNVVLEAMASGCPVASTDYSDVKRILPLPWQVAGSREAAELAGIVERCGAERERVGSLQRRWVEEHGTVSRAAQSLLAVYQSADEAPSHLAKPLLHG